MSEARQKLYFVLGCTASGKGGLGRELARRLGGQIISVDSMKIYRRMDIGTAKPSKELLAEIPHHCIDIVEPAEGFSVARYVEFADRTVENIRAAGAIPLAVGGTSLYIKTLREGLFEGPPADQDLRESLRVRARQEGLAALHTELARVDPQAGARIHPNDERRILRALEVYHTTGRPISEMQQQWDAGQDRYDSVLIGIRREKDELNGRINRRARRMMDAGLVDEVASLLGEPDGLSDQAASAVGYAEIISHIEGRCTLDEAFERIKINTRRLAKKQRTWQRRWTDVRWFDVTADDSAEAVADRVQQEIQFE